MTSQNPMVENTDRKINIKSIIIIILAMIVGVYVMFIKNQIITGLIIIAGGISLTR